MSNVKYDEVILIGGTLNVTYTHLPYEGDYWDMDRKLIEQRMQNGCQKHQSVEYVL